MDSIYHEKQEGSLCAVHCLNSLLQGSYFSAVDLATIANQMDCEERQRMAELGTDTPEYQDFFKESSNNMDDSGMFSIQVMNVALEVWELSLTPFTSTVAPSAIAARDDPTSGRAYICNMKEHWFTIRKLGTQWFNLNSLLAYPELLSDTYVSLFLAQLQSQGYCIYIVEGALPPCEADTLLASVTVTQDIKPPLLSEEGAASSSSRHQEDDDIAAAVAASLTHSSGQASTKKDDEADLENALQLSLTEHLTRVPLAKLRPEDDLAKALRLSMANSGGEDDPSPLPASPLVSPSAASSSATPDLSAAATDEEARQLQAALALSLEQASTSTQSSCESLDASALREKRLAFFNKKPPGDDS